MLNGGNGAVQQSLYQYLLDSDSDCRMLEHLEKRFSRALEGLVEAKRSGKLEAIEEDADEEALVDYDSVVLTARLVHLFCEGHHFGFQNYVRVQEIGASPRVAVPPSLLFF